MNIEQMRARLGEIAALIAGIQAVDSQYSDGQLAEIETLNTEFETLEKQLEAAEKAEAIKARAAQSAGRKTASPAPAAAAAPRIEFSGRPNNERFGGFNSSGEFLMAVKRAGQTGDMDKRFLQNSTAYEKVGEDGGFLVPEDIGTAIVKKLESTESLMSSCNVINVSGNALTLPIDESQPWNQGITAYWTAEGATITESKPVFSEASWRLHKLAALVKTTDELLDDATALESYIMNGAPLAITAKVNDAIISGNGAGKPQGIINSPFAVTVSKESGPQTADTVVAANVLKMYSRMFPNSRSKAAWYINPAVEEQLRLMVDPNGDYIFISPGGQMNQTPYGTLLGRPVIPMMSALRAIGDVGDIVFADLSFYTMIKKASGVKSATSIHLLFDKEQTAFRFTLRVDGKCPFKTPVTTQYGSYQMSAIVLLEAR